MRTFRRIKKQYSFSHYISRKLKRLNIDSQYLKKLNNEEGA